MESVKCRFSKCRFSAELEKLAKIFEMGAASKNQSKKPLGQHFHSVVVLAAQCEIPPHIAQYPFEIVSQRGVLRPFALLS